jgi:hypothetical protein
MKRIHPSFTLLVVAIFAYGLLIPQLGFYWDDLPMSWIRYQLGADAMTRYFSTNRPIWALLYQVTTSILPHTPIYWQIFALLWRWLGAVVLFFIGRQLFPKSEKFAFTLSALFLLYPGFNQQWVSYLYTHFFIVIFFFLLSYYLMLRKKTIPALIFSALNLWMMEYFFVLELMRPFVIFTTLRDDPANPKGLATENTERTESFLKGLCDLCGDARLKTRIQLALKKWIPYLTVFALAVLSRLFLFNNQVYKIGLNEEEAAPTRSLLGLVQNVFSSLWVTTVSAWAQIFKFPDTAVDGVRTIALYVVVMVTAGALTLFALLKQNEGEKNRVESAWGIGLGLVMLALAGPPFWLTGVPVSLGFPANRATLSFMFGASFIFAGLLDLLPNKFKYILVLFVALAAGRQFLWSNDFRRDWSEQKNMFWQMTWRAPGLEKNTIVLINEELDYYADNSLGAALNWIYAPDNHSNVVDYVLFYPTNRQQLPLTLDTPLDYDFLAGQFHGNTSQTVAFYYAPPKCLRLLDPEIDSINKMIPDDSLLRDAALLSSTKPVLSEAAAMMPGVYGAEPNRGWCYYFQKADLARQMGDWEEVARLGDIAFKLDDYPNDPIERFVFIEGYAHTGDWETAVKSSKLSDKVSRKYVSPLLCKLWMRIGRETEPTPEQIAALAEAQKEFECTP